MKCGILLRVLTDKRHQSFLFVIGELVSATALGQAVVSTGRAGTAAAAIAAIGAARATATAVTVEAAFEMLLPELAEPRIAAIEDPRSFDRVAEVLILAVSG